MNTPAQCGAIKPPKTDIYSEAPQFNPNRMEQRNGRVDRHGQKSPHVDIFHFASPDSEDGSPGHDHSFLLRVACKVDEIREDLGRVAPVLAERIEARMLRSGSGSLDLEAVLATRRDQARADLEVLKRDFARQLGEVHRRFKGSIEEIELSPESLQRAVRVGLRISDQPELVPTVVERPAGPVEAFTVADLSGTWPETLIGLHDEVADKRRPVTFDAAVASGHDDVVHLHLGHPLVARCLRTLRAPVWGAAVERQINRACVRFAEVDEPIAVAHARIVVNGADGSTLDEVIEPVAVRVGGRRGRLNVGETRSAVAAVVNAPRPRPAVRDRFVE